MQANRAPRTTFLSQISRDLTEVYFVLTLIAKAKLFKMIMKSEPFQGTEYIVVIYLSLRKASLVASSYLRLSVVIGRIVVEVIQNFPTPPSEGVLSAAK